jgi:hypothetical protein
MLAADWSGVKTGVGKKLGQGVSNVLPLPQNF